MKQRCLTLILALLVFGTLFAACGTKEENQAKNEQEYFDVSTSQKDIGTPSQKDENWRFLNTFFYKESSVQIWGVKSDVVDSKALFDVYMYREDESTELLVSGIAEEYMGSYYVDFDGNIYISAGDKFIRMTAEGEMLYSRSVDGNIYDICQLKDGAIVLLLQRDDGEVTLGLLDSMNGNIAEKTVVGLGKNIAQYICGYADGLVLLNNTGLWNVDLADGSMEKLFDFVNTSFALEAGFSDFRMVDENNMEFLYRGKIETLQIDTVVSKKEIIVIRDYTFGDVFKEYVNQFNQQSEKYFVQLEEGKTGIYNYSELEQFMVQTNMEIANGKGADIISAEIIPDVEGYIKNGALEDLKSYMDGSGIEEDDFFPVTFASYRNGEKIYSIHVDISLSGGLCLQRFLTGEAEETDVEIVLDSLLDVSEQAFFKKNYTSSKVLRYFLEASDSLLGMVDWSNGICDFDNDIFIKLLEVSKIYGYNSQYTYPEVARGVEDYTFYLFEYEEELASQEMKKIGHFFDDGCRMTVSDSSSWVMNSNSENKEGAWEFFRFLLSEEFQASWENNFFPTNKNAFEIIAQREMEAGPIVVSDGSILYKAGTAYYDEHGKEAYIEHFRLTQEKIDEIRDELENARVLPHRVKPILNIILEEAAAYFAGDKTMDEVIPIIENRVQLYLEERN